METTAKIRRQLARFLSKKLGIKVSTIRKRGEERFPVYVDSAFIPIYRKYCHDTMVPWQGLYSSWLAARYVGSHAIPGAIVECGVYRGGCSMIMAESAFKVGKPDLDVWLYDTFAGMSEPTDHDFKGITAQNARVSARKKFKNLNRGDYVDWCLGSLDDVRSVVQRGPLPFKHFRFVEGKVEDTIPASMPEKISLLRLDTDFYESTKHELEHLFPRLSPSGVIMVDDYSAWAGARKAVDEFFTDASIDPLLIPDSHYGALIGVKPA